MGVLDDPYTFQSE